MVLYIQIFMQGSLALLKLFEYPSNSDLSSDKFVKHWCINNDLSKIQLKTTRLNYGSHPQNIIWCNIAREIRTPRSALFNYRRLVTGEAAWRRNALWLACSALAEVCGLRTLWLFHALNLFRRQTHRPASHVQLVNNVGKVGSALDLQFNEPELQFNTLCY